MKKLLKLAREFEQSLIKVADYPTKDVVSGIVKSAVKDLISDNSDIMEGILYASNVEIYQHDDVISVKFILNFDRKKAGVVEAKKAARDPQVYSATRIPLQNRFQNFQFQVKWTEAPADSGWFAKEYD